MVNEILRSLLIEQLLSYILDGLLSENKISLYNVYKNNSILYADTQCQVDLKIIIKKKKKLGKKLKNCI